MVVNRNRPQTATDGWHARGDSVEYVLRGVRKAHFL